MAVTVERRPDMLVFHFSGEVCVEDILDIADWCDETDRLTPGLPRFADASAISCVRVNFSDVVHVTGERRRLARPQAVRIAVMVGSDLAYGVARMYQTLLDHPQIDLEVFRDREAAFAWLGVSDPGAC
jgi:hypothetical protein